MMYHDYSKSKLSGAYYGGSEKKLGILVDGVKYMIKFQKNTPFGLRFNHLSEYIGSHIFQILGYEAHETRLGLYKGNEVVLCKDFNTKEIQFVPFNDVGDSSLDVDKEEYQYTYDDIVSLLESNRKLTNVDETVSFFFEMYIVDALLGNFDRHGGNWGFFKYSDKYTLAPVFDNGSCLYPQMINEDEMKAVIESEEETNQRIYKYPTSQILLNGKKSSYFEVISSLQYELCNEALVKVYNKIKIEELIKVIDDLEISSIHRKFYIHMLNARYEKIIKYSYDKLMEKIYANNNE